MDIKIGQTVFLAMIPGGSSGITGIVTGFNAKHGATYVNVRHETGKRYSAPAEHAQTI
jgi:hypothetical protein